MSAKQFSNRKIWHLSREEKYGGGKEHLAAEPEQAEKQRLVSDVKHQVLGVSNLKLPTRLVYMVSSECCRTVIIFP